MMQSANHLTALQMLLARDAETGVLHTQHLVLLARLAERGALSLYEAATVLDLSHSQTSRLVTRLIEKGYATRAFDPQDSRRHRIIVTPRGVTLDARVRSYVAAATPASRRAVELSTEDTAA